MSEIRSFGRVNATALKSISKPLKLYKHNDDDVEAVEAEETVQSFLCPYTASRFVDPMKK